MAESNTKPEREKQGALSSLYRSPGKITSHQSRPAKCGDFYCHDLWGTPKLIAKQDTKRMSRRTIAIAAALSVLALGSPLNVARANPPFVQYFNQGAKRFNSGNYQGALADYTKAIEINPQSAEAYNYRGDAKSALQDFQGAIADHTKAIEIKPQFAEAYVNRGMVKTYLKDYQGAIADYSKAIEINPQNATTYYNRAYSKGKSKNTQGAIADYSKAIEINPQYADAYVDRGIDRETMNDLKGACRDWRKAAGLGKENAAEWVKKQC